MKETTAGKLREKWVPSKRMKTRLGTRQYPKMIKRKSIGIWDRQAKLWAAK